VTRPTPAPVGGAPDGAGAKARLGVLFVHGIGQQARGETLVQWLDPLVDWVSAWLLGAREWKAGAELPRCDVRRAVLTADREPAHAEVEIHAPPGWVGAEAAASRLVVAEAYWAETFPAPSAAEVTDWLLEIGPMTLLLHAGLLVRRAWRGLRASRGAATRTRAALALTRATLGVLLSVAVLPVFLAALLLVAALRLVPIPGVAAALRKVQAALAAVIGDSTVFASSPARLAAIVTEVRASMAWLEPRCEAMIVVAHSQGAAVLRQALDGDAALPPPAKLAGVVTLGAGLRKLDVLLGVHRDRARGDRGDALMHAGLALFARTATVVGGAALVARVVGFRIVPGWVALLFSILLGANFLLYALVDLERDGRVERWWRSVRAHHPDAEWLDLYASRDPVSNGPLWEGRAPEGAASCEVFNARSLVADHTSYWHNRAGFVARVAAFLARVGGLEVPLHDLRPGDAGLIEREAAMRGLRIGFVDALLAAVWVAGLTPLAFGDRERLALFGQGLRANLLATASHVGVRAPDFVAGRWLAAADAASVAGWSYAGLLILCFLVARSVKHLWNRVGAATLAQHAPVDVNVEVLPSVFAALAAPIAAWWFLDRGGVAVGVEVLCAAGMLFFALWLYRVHRTVGLR
jgi:hypothetical protein